MDEKLLQSLGLSTSEVKVFKVAMKIKGTTTAQLASMTKIKRTTAYHVAHMLTEKGLLIEDISKRPKIFTPATPEQIEEMIEMENVKQAQRELTLRKVAAELSRATAGDEYNVPRLRFVEEEKLENFFYAEIPKWHHSVIKRDSTWWGFQDHTFVDHFPHVIDWYWKKFGDEFSVKLLSNESTTERSMVGKYHKRHIKHWNKSGNFISTTWIAGDYQIIVNTRHKPFYLVEIFDGTLSNDMREIFKNLWSLIS